MSFRRTVRTLQIAASFLALILIVNLAVHGWLGVILETTALFLTLAISINLAVYGWLGVAETWSDKGARAGDLLAHLLVAASFTTMAVGTWYALSFVVRPFG